MSQSLDCQGSIENLQKELTDLQGAILDVFSRTGRVRFPSWKFPDRLSCDLDMVALLEQYDFVDGDGAFNEHSHTVLLELVIDSFNSYVERVWRGQRRGQTQQRGFLSVGVVVRNYWSNLLHFVSRTGTQKDSERKTEPNILDSDETEALACAFHQMMSRTRPSHNTPSGPTVDNRTAGCQTTESALAPCDDCRQVQSTLRKTGAALVGLFQSEGLPSSLQPLLAAVEETLELGHDMTAGDVAQWASVQLGDVRRLGKHLQNVRATVQPLKERLAAAEAVRERFRFRLERAQLELQDQMEKRQATIDQLGFALGEAQRFTEATEQRLQEEQQQFKRENESLEESNARLGDTVAVQKRALQALECEKTTLQETAEAEYEARRQLQHRIQTLESELSETKVLLHQESDKYHGACRQQESVLMKQQSLLERAGALDGERQELRRQLAEQEERRLDLQSELQQMSKEKEQLQAQLTQQQNCTLELQKDKQRLETQMGALVESVAELKELVEDLKERERLLVVFPHLSPLSRTQPESTGNVLLDMELQMQANGLRINILQRENANLRSSSEKLGERAQRGAAARDGAPRSAAVDVLRTAHKTTKRNTATEASPQQTWSEETDRSLTPNSPPLSGSAAWLAYSNKLKEARRVQSGRASAGSRGRRSTAAVSPLQIRVQTLNFDMSHSMATKSHIKTLSPCLPPHCNGWKQRRK
ncbi:coiled-coil domain-containing protein 157-like isoform X2 [Solea solea]|uniref:coiled-coil domain-containing protein 157-like isoform X2 n=1 Tax=Solea solea TaxID=90069 RepID=UPI00272C855C|nr:coiled-coil domain-containing protein 157-like isoform X2 [Solea solea]